MARKSAIANKKIAQAGDLHVEAWNAFPEDPDNAIEDSSKAIELLESNDIQLSRRQHRSSELVLSQSYVVRGLAYEEKEEYDKAIEDYSRAIELSPDTALFECRGRVFFEEKGEHDKAIEDYSRAISLEPNYSAWYTSRGEVYEAKEEYDKAVEDYSRAIGLEPNMAHLFERRARVYEKKEWHDRAAMDRGKAAELTSRGDTRRHEEKSNLRKAAEGCAGFAALGYFWGGLWLIGEINDLIWKVLFWIGVALIIMGAILYDAYCKDQSEKKN